MTYKEIKEILTEKFINNNKDEDYDWNFSELAYRESHVKKYLNETFGLVEVAEESPHYDGYDCHIV